MGDTGGDLGTTGVQTAQCGRQVAQETTHVFGSVVHLPLSGRRWRGREEGRERGASSRVGVERKQCPDAPATPAVWPTWASASMMSLMRGGPRASAPSMRT